MVEVDGLVAGVIGTLAQAGRRDETRRVHRTTHNDVRNRESFAIGVKATLKLVCRRSATPQKPLRERETCHVSSLVSKIMYVCIQSAVELAPDSTLLRE